MDWIPTYMDVEILRLKQQSFNLCKIQFISKTMFLPPVHP